MDGGELSSCAIERFADDVIVHCRTEREAKEVRAAIGERFRNCGLELHPEKTKIVYCKVRKGSHTHEKFDFLGYEFRPQKTKESHWQGLPELQSSNFHRRSEGDPKHDPELETTCVQR
jgi:Reverse transcriptase (RNA-dependent DNA polymerase)